MTKEKILELERATNLLSYTEALKEKKYDAIEKMTQNKVELETAKAFINKEIEAAKKACQPENWEKEQEKLQKLLADEKTKDTQETREFKEKMDSIVNKWNKEVQKIVEPILKQSMKVKLRLLTQAEFNILLTPAYDWVQVGEKSEYVQINRITTDVLPLLNLLVIKNKGDQENKETEA